MRICLISTEYPPDTGWGGIGTYTYQMAHALSAIGHDVEVVSLQGDEKARVKAANNVPGSNSIRVSRAPWSDTLSELRMLNVTMPASHFAIKTSFALWQAFCKRHDEKPFDVAEVPELLASGIMPIAAKKLATVVKLHTPHSKFAAEQLHGISLSFDNQFVHMLERITMLMADEVCSPSDDLAKYVANDLGVSLASIKIVRNPVNTEQFSPQGEIASLPDGSRILFVGRLEERKGVSYLIEAVPQVLKEFPDAQFVLVGSDTPHAPGGSALAHCKQMLQQNDCLANVTFVPQVDLAQMPKYYRAADICVVPSLYDNAPYTIIEAMSSGKALIGTTSGGIREYVEHWRTGLLVEPKNSQALAYAMVRLLRSKEERLRLGLAARTHVVSVLSNEAIARQMVSLYESAIEKYNRREKARLYSKDSGYLLHDALCLLKAYDQMIYDSHYRSSLQFRINHWLRLAQKQPEILRTRVALRLARPLVRHFPKSFLAELVLKLERNLQLLQSTATSNGNRI